MRRPSPEAPMRALVASAAIALAVLGLGLGLTQHPASATTASPSTDPLRDQPGIIVDGRTPPDVFARAWIVVDAKTGDVLAAKNAHLKMRPASTLKTLTAVTLIPRMDLKDEYKVQWEDAHVMGSAVGIVPGSRYTINDLFYGLMLPSGNDAARALASANGGSRTTVRQMNEAAQRLGALDTTAVNPSGLDAPGQWSSAFDLAIFARQGLESPDFRRYVSTVSHSFPAQEPKQQGKQRDSFMIYNQNPLLLEGYRGILGVKTGYTTLAGRTYVAAAERGNQTLIVALMGIVEPSEAAAKRLFDWGWKHGTSVTPVGSLDAPEEPVTAETTTADPSPSTTALAGPADATDEAASSSSGPSILLWGLAGVLLVALGWALQRRRS